MESQGIKTTWNGIMFPKIMILDPPLFSIQMCNYLIIHNLTEIKLRRLKIFILFSSYNLFGLGRVLKSKETSIQLFCKNLLHEFLVSSVLPCHFYFTCSTHFGWSSKPALQPRVFLKVSFTVSDCDCDCKNRCDKMGTEPIVWQRFLQEKSQTQPKNHSL